MLSLKMDTKFKFYQEHGIEEYYLYNPKKNRLQGWLRKGETLEAIAQMEDWKSPLLGIKFTTREGDLVLFHPNGERFVDFVEVVEQRDRQKQRAILAENQRDRERLEKELEKQRTDREHLEKELKKQRTDREYLEKELEKQRADRAESDLQKMRDRLLQLGIDPDTLS